MLQRLMSLTRSAIDDYNMINDGDRIAIGVSGGKDSLTLLRSLHGLKRFYPKKFEIEAITLDMGFENVDLGPIQKMCDELDIRYTIKSTNIAKIVFETRKETNPCSLCAKMRRGALHAAALELGCKKVALGHHHDDVIETLFLSLFFEGRIYSFSPVTYLDRMDITLIRPLIYTPEMMIRGFTKKENLPVVKNPCPMDGKSKRGYIKDLLTDLTKENKGLKERLFGAIQRSEIKGWQI